MIQELTRMAPSSARFRLVFETAPVKGNVSIPYGKHTAGTSIEPVCRDYPDLGNGGATQVIVNGIDIPIREIWDMLAIPPAKIYP
jgi:hypothetical protein